ncbi:hypothetical protein THAOC_37381, partial [Thalassiosira oceanica]
FGTSEAVQIIDLTDETYVATRVRIRLSGPQKILNIAEVEVMGFEMAVTFDLSMHCKYNAVSAALPSAPGGLEMGLCVYGNDVLTAAAYNGQVREDAWLATSGNSFRAIPGSRLTEPQHFYADNSGWNLTGFVGTPCGDGIFLQSPTMIAAGEIVSVTLNQLHHLGGTPAAELLPLLACQGDCDNDSDCLGDLKCFQRNGDDLLLPPGCGGSALPDYDFCYLDNLPGGINHYPVIPCSETPAEMFCYDREFHSTASQSSISDYPLHAKVGMDFEICSNICERLANNIANIINPYRGVDINMNWNSCYCLFDYEPTCPDYLAFPCFSWHSDGDGLGPVSHSSGEPGTYPYPVIRASSSTSHLTQLWDGTVSVDSGVCVFFTSDQRDLWGPSLIALAWNYEGNPHGFGYPTQMSLYCKHNVTSAELPPFYDFGDDISDSTGIHHGMCTFGDMHAVPFATNDAGLTYEPVEIPFVDLSSISQDNTVPNGDPNLAICVMSANKSEYPQIASWQQSLEADGFTRLEIEDLHLVPRDENSDPFGLSMHCKYVSVERNELQHFGGTPAADKLPLLACQGDCDNDR